jgi:hypothetical protein
MNRSLCAPSLADNTEQTHYPAAAMDCELLAPFYQTLEYLSFGRQLERSRFAFLGEVSGARRAIICGGGDGRFLARLLRVNARVQIDFVERSAQMLAIAERRVAAMGPAARKRVRFQYADLREFQPSQLPAHHAPENYPPGYDLIVTNFFLDCFSEIDLALVVSRLAAWGAPGARWLLSEFREPPGVLGRIWTRAVIRGLYAAFRVTTGLRVVRLPDYAAAIASAGFVPRWQEQRLGGLLHASFWESCGPSDDSSQSPGA